MNLGILYPSSANIARGIENLVIREKTSGNLAIQTSCGLLSRVISITVFPLFLAFELVFKRIPKLLFSTPTLFSATPNDKFNQHVDKIYKFFLGIICSPAGLYSPDIVAGLFLKSPKEVAVRPFGVEQQYGKKVSDIHYPHTIEAVQELVVQAKKEGKKVSIIGAGMSQGKQTIPKNQSDLVINMQNLNQMEFGSDTIKVQAGATWEQIQVKADQLNKSVIVKQASDIFSVGGSIGINCHGWAHEYGAIASTVESLDIIDANGELRTLTSEDELFGCMFGTLGYFGIVVSAKLKITDNEPLVQRAQEVAPEAFIEHYKTNIKGHNIPLFGGRLVLDTLSGDPLRQVEMVSYEKDPVAKSMCTHPLQIEPRMGTRFERIALQALSHLPSSITRRLISAFWNEERRAMFTAKRMTRNEALHPPIKAFNVLHRSNLHAQWLQEYFIHEKNLPEFLRFLGNTLKTNDVRLINATIRPTPQDQISILPYAEQDRYAVVICFSQLKTDEAIAGTKKWIMEVNEWVIANGDVYYQAYMPYTTREQFEQCYGKQRVERMRELKKKYDPDNLFGNGHTKKYFDVTSG